MNSSQTEGGNAPSARAESSPTGEQQPEKKSQGPNAPRKQGAPRKKRGSRRPWDISQFPVPEVPGKTRFHDLDLPVEVMHAIADLGFEYCSPIQAQSLPYALNGQDLVGKAQTGTGKTAAFLVAIIDDLLKHPLEQERYAGEARALIIAPTRELVLQIAEDAKALTRYTDLEVHTLVGGMDYGKQQRDLQDRLVDILVATPGRLLDFCSNGDAHVDQIEVLVIDEADRMLDMGFIPQIRRIIQKTPPKSHRQTLLFSATFSPDVMNLVDQWTVDRVTVEIEPESVATDTVTQHVYLAATDEKYTLLYNILKQDDVDSLIVFSNRRDECRDLYDKLKAHGFSVGLLSGEIQQKQRVRTLDAFKSGEIQVLVATDVAGRGIHIDGISHVVNLNLPEEPEDYVHRIGRTGRAGKLGTSISFACEEDAFRLMPIQELLGADLKCTQPPEELLVPPPEVKVPPRPRQRRGGGGGRSGGGNRPRRRS
ncbi:ATP-dependent RNA helicase RhlB [Gilvimarinus sp. F26214L]|uniref:ATP-dependent RNA helicase RhlB n=1 Tax=Gilvimarinus sp. DZF01 TaxID=3461371 RepID=UPI004045F65D